MKNNNIFIAVAILSLYACHSEVSMHNDLVDITSAECFEDRSFKHTIHLNSFTFNDSVIHHPIRLALQDSILFSLDAGYGTDTLVRCFSIFNKRYLGSIFLKGNGPTELLSASCINLSSDSSSFWTFDITKQAWFGRKFTTLNDYLSLKKEDYTIINLRNSSLLGLDNPTWIKNGFVANSLFKYKERFFIFSSENMLKQSITNPNLHFKNIYNENILADIFSTKLSITPDHSKIVLAGRYMDLIEIYNIDGDLLKILKGPEKEFNFKFDIERSIKQSVLVKSPETKRAYLSIKTTSDKIYALYSGKNKKDKEHYSYSKILYVFSLDGSLLLKYLLDTPIIDFVIDEKRNKIYATSINAEIICFDLNKS
ncbi:MULTISPECIES: BF3164 family lipoprotein [Parabacteroides]|uniref:BF3164 family lipoprotein n=1 Tax=Parabacteroides provencensis TaxID=1944636 RepID=UPI000C1556F9|nr:BF3164 family lipoprotein [Parabacteroides provencensis]